MPVDEGISQWGATIVKVRVQSRSDNGPLNRSTRPSFFNRDNAYTVKPNGTSKSIWKKDRRSKSKQKLSKWQVFSIVRRLLVITAACHYINISMVATWRTIQVSRYMSNPTRSFEVFTAQYIAGYVEDGLISDSKLVREVLKNDTTPRDFVLFLESDTKVSVEGCSQVPLFDSNIYNHAYLTQTYEEIVRDTSYNTTMLTELELIAVVVDCSSTQLEIGDPSTVRVFNLARSRNDSADVYLVTVSLSVQSYEMWTYKKLGPAVAGMITVIHDMQADITKQIYMLAQTYPYQRSMEFEIYDFIGITGESYRELQSIPRDPRIEPAKRLVTSRKRGFYDGDIQSNIHSTYSVLDVADAKSALTRWE